VPAGYAGYANTPDSSPKTTQSPFMKNQIALKQFLDAADPTKACYQAIVCSHVNINKMNDAGWLFDPLSGDASGGIAIRIYGDEGEGIVKSLGLQCSEQGTEHKSDGTIERYTAVRPMLPFWWNLDLNYGSASNLCWRGSGPKWSTPTTIQPPTIPPKKNPAVPLVCDHRLITSGSDLEVTPPFAFPAPVVIRIFPFGTEPQNGRPSVPQTLLDNTVNFGDTGNRSFTAVGDYICVLISEFQDMQTNAASPRLADSELTFAVPAYYKETATASGDAVLVPVLVLGGTEWNAITDREVYGRLTLQGQFIKPPVDLLKELPPSHAVEPAKAKHYDVLLMLATNLCPDINEYSRSTLFVALGLASVDHSDDPDAEKHFPPPTRYSNTGNSPKPFDLWLYRIINNFGSGKPSSFTLSSYAAKQIRDAENPDKNSSYRGLVKVSRTFSDATVDYLQNAADLDRKVYYKHVLELIINEYDDLKLRKSMKLSGCQLTDNPLPTTPLRQVVHGQFQAKRFKDGYEILPVRLPFYIKGSVTAGAVDVTKESWDRA
jgi:hypothetical protein